MKIANKLFEAHRFPTFWCLLISVQFAIMITAAMDNIFFLSFGFVSLLAFGTWVEDIEAGRHNSLKKNIITLLIALSCILILLGFIHSTDARSIVYVFSFIMLVINVLFLLATICESKIHH